MTSALTFVKSIAYDVRDWAEDKAFERDGGDYFDLCGWCAIASAELHRRLTKNNYQSEIHVSENDDYAHAFVMFEDYVIDVTATQFADFANQRVVIMHHREAECYEYYISKHLFDSAKIFRKWQISNEWPREQTAFPT